MTLGYHLLMRVLTLLMLCVFSAGLTAETVYKTVDEEGNVVFSDQPSEQAEVIELPELQTIENPNPAAYRPPARSDDDDDETESYYQVLSFVSPADGEGYRNNAGDVTIQLSLQPSLKRGHRVIIKMDGKEISTGKALSVSLNNVDRGTHSLAAAVVDSSGTTQISTSSSFTMLRVALGGAR